MVFNTVNKQSLFDLAVQLYANVLSLPQLLNGPFAGDIDLSAVVVTGKAVDYDLEDDVTLKKVLKKMDNSIVHTYKIRLDETDNAEFNRDFNFDFTS